MLLPGMDLYSVGSLALWRFSQLFLPNMSEHQKKANHLSAEPLALCHIMVNLALVIALRP